MAYDEDNAEVLRREFADLTGVSEKKMFGGLCFLLNGNMICGVHQDGGMARVGKALEEKALEIDGVEPLSFTGRPMGGMVDLSAELFDDKRRLRKVLKLARVFVGGLPVKQAKPKKK